MTRKVINEMSEHCQVSGCLRPVYRQNLCGMHVTRKIRHGNTGTALHLQRGKLDKQRAEIEDKLVYILLPHDYRAIIDIADMERVVLYNWHRKTVGYAYSGRAKAYLHQFIFGVSPKGMHIDHINRNKLDNRRANLRCIPMQENLRNSDFWENRKGYSLHKASGRYRYYLHDGDKVVHLGYVGTEEEAKLAVAAAKQRLAETGRLI